MGGPDRGRVPIPLRWVGACALGEGLGLVASGLIAASIAPALGPPEGAGGRLLLQVTMIGAGTLEGTLVGLAQWLVLRRIVPGLRGPAWVVATALGFAAGWLVGALASALEASGPPSLATVVAVGAVTGAVLGLGVGLGQALVLWRHEPRVGRWVAVNVVAWALGMVLSVAGASLAPSGPYGVGSAAAALVTGTAIGALVGALTAPFLPRRRVDAGRPLLRERAAREGG